MHASAAPSPEPGGARSAGIRLRLDSTGAAERTPGRSMRPASQHGTAQETSLQPTNIADPAYFHKVVDCQWACPAHTPVPEYIRLIAAGRYADAYMVNWVSNVFPGILGRTCDRPCEPACRRGRVEEDNGRARPSPSRSRSAASSASPPTTRSDVARRACRRVAPRNGKRVACIGAGPASLTVARDLAPLGYAVTVFDGEAKAGGFMRSADPALSPARVGDRRGDGLHPRSGRRVSRRRTHRLDEGTARARRAATRSSSAAARRAGATCRSPAARRQVRTSTSASTGWLRSRSATSRAIGKRVIVLGGGNTAMDCCRSARRLGASDVKVIVRSGFEEMKASPWEKEDAQHEGIPIINFHVPKAFVHEGGRLVGMTLRDRAGALRRRRPAPPRADRCARRASSSATTCSSRSARRTPSRGSSATAASTSTAGACRCSTRRPSSRRVPRRVLRRRRGLRAEEHHHRRRARPRGGGVDRPLPATARTCARAPRRTST